MRRLLFFSTFKTSLWDRSRFDKRVDGVNVLSCLDGFFSSILPFFCVDMIGLALPRDSIELVRTTRSAGRRSHEKKKHSVQQQQPHTVKHKYIAPMMIMIDYYDTSSVGTGDDVLSSCMCRYLRAHASIKRKRKTCKKNAIYGKQWKSVNVYCKWPQAAIGQNTPSETATQMKWDGKKSQQQPHQWRKKKMKSENKNSSRRLAIHVRSLTLSRSQRRNRVFVSGVERIAL